MAPPNTNPPPPKLSLHSLPTNHHHHHLPPPPTPPHPSSASVPFAWELIPGKPRPTSSSSSITTTITTTQPKSLNPPPNLHLLSSSPTTVLDGPYLSRSDSPSLRRLSLTGGGGGGGGVIRGKTGKEKDGGLLKRWGVRLRSEAPHSVSSSSSSSLSSEVAEEEEEVGGATKVKITRFRRNGNSFSLSSTRTTTHFWGSIYENIKQVVHRRG
ncbi:hypothetical protein QJS04_geneDACA008329 [Acorus gramineus]|uniref:Uncharacterized protein n=1 Tax=Acorus gramineus TaxID=55184 RepID=A0AAV9B059_ACOGR|nr:hypothetical protein QJS04_geneDACA008329 [Acorus gramineus]